MARSLKDPIPTHDVNVTGTLNVLVAAKELGCRGVVMSSSSAVYGNHPLTPKEEEISPTIPRSPYAASKAAGEGYLKLFYECYGLHTLGFRYFNVYGPFQDVHSEYAAVIPKFISRALKGQDLCIEGDGNQTRDFVYIRDVVQANLLAFSMEKPQGECLNIGFGQSVSIQTLAELIIGKTRSSSRIIHTRPRPGDVRDSVADISRAKRSLGFNPAVPLSDGLTDTIHWYRDNLSFMEPDRSSEKAPRPFDWGKMRPKGIEPPL